MTKRYAIMKIAKAAYPTPCAVRLRVAPAEAEAHAGIIVSKIRVMAVDTIFIVKPFLEDLVDNGQAMVLLFNFTNMLLCPFFVNPVKKCCNKNAVFLICPGHDRFWHEANEAGLLFYLWCKLKEEL
jgi:hypothetical protein